VAFVVSQSIVGVLLALAVSGYEWFLGNTFRRAGIDLLYFSPHPWEPARTAMQFGLLAFHAAFAWLAVLALRLALARWRFGMGGRLPLVVLIACWGAPAAFVFGRSARGLSHPLETAILAGAMGAAVLLAPRGIARLRRASQGFRLIVVFLALFALWANLHGGFVAGFLLLGLATVGLAIDHWRGIPGSLPLSRIAALGVVAVLAAVTVTIATPLGAAIWSYLLSFQNHAISLASTEWGPAFGSPPALIYLFLAACFAAWMWVRSPRPRRVTTLLVTAGFLVFAGYSIRNVVFVGPVLALQVAWTAPNRSPTQLRGPVALIGTAAAAAALLWAAVLGPARDDPTLGFPVADYAIAHPPKDGRIVTYAGVGSYINWRSPKTPVVLNGWLEQYTPQELRDNYRVLRAGTAADLPGALRRIHAGAVIVHLPSAIRRLEAAGFRPEFTSADATYLVRISRGRTLSGR
jgi:hypothetical protein